VSRSTIPTRDALKMAGVVGDGRPSPKQGAAIFMNQTPVNRAQRRLLSRIKRRRAKTKE
jgi:hypothetical protein